MEINCKITSEDASENVANMIAKVLKTSIESIFEGYNVGLKSLEFKRHTTVKHNRRLK